MYWKLKTPILSLWLVILIVRPRKSLIFINAHLNWIWEYRRLLCSIHSLKKMKIFQVITSHVNNLVVSLNYSIIYGHFFLTSDVLKSHPSLRCQTTDSRRPDVDLPGKSQVPSVEDRISTESWRGIEYPTHPGNHFRGD